MMDNKSIAASLKLGAQLLELYGENKFKIRSYDQAARVIEQLEAPLTSFQQAEIEELEGIGANIAKKVYQLSETGSFDELERLLSRTPEGILELIQIKGIGPKKVAQVWEALGVLSPDDLLNACRQGYVAQLKGWGQKSAAQVEEALTFYEQSKGQLILPHADAEAQGLLDLLNQCELIASAALVGQLRRRCATISTLDFLVVPHHDPEAVAQYLDQSGLLSREGNQHQWLSRATGVPVNLAIFQAAGQAWIPPEMREAPWKNTQISAQQVNQLITGQDLKGCLHNHSTYSDGAHSLKAMAEACQAYGYTYFGIADHSKAAFYANGLDEQRVAEQKAAIQQLNEALYPFRIFHGVEVDILKDGQLDYDAETLQQLDYVVASIHTPLRMDKETATQRLLTAIRNPYTTILGHPTGRLLLRRAGYPVDHQQIIDACAQHQVVIEVNSNPRRAFYSVSIRTRTTPAGSEICSMVWMSQGKPGFQLTL
jgi:DNA polymerase (family 10)